jgi:hypothetical protein
LLLAACGRPPIRDEVTIQFHEDRDDITVTAETWFDRGRGNERVNAARTAAVQGLDDWSVRFARLDPKSDEVTFARHQGELERVTRRIHIPSDDLQRVFSDTSITVNLVRSDGWQELSLIPGTSSRATREQTRHFNGELRAWSEEVARYFVAIDHLYDYLDENPHRARFVFAALLNEKDAGVLEDELPLLEAAVNAMERIGERMDATENDAFTFAEEADLIYNPFPARMVIRVPHEKDLVIERVDLFKTIAALEGKWISPDPLAALLKDASPTSEQLAELPRKSASVINPSEIETAIREELVQPRTYSIRWTD